MGTGRAGVRDGAGISLTLPLRHLDRLVFLVRQRGGRLIPFPADREEMIGLPVTLVTDHVPQQDGRAVRQSRVVDELLDLLLEIGVGKIGGHPACLRAVQLLPLVDHARERLQAGHTQEQGALSAEYAGIGIAALARSQVRNRVKSSHRSLLLLGVNGMGPEPVRTPPALCETGPGRTSPAAPPRCVWVGAARSMRLR